MWPRWVKDVLQEEPMSYFLTAHSNRIERTENIHGRVDRLEGRIVDDKPLESFFVQ